MVGTHIGPYEVLGRLGRGGMAEVFRARYRGAAGAEREVVIKQLLPLAADQQALIDMFIAEARLTLKLSHGNLVQVFDFGEADGRYFLAMELVDGVSLAQVLKAAQASGAQGVPAKVAVTMALGMLRGLHYAHTRRDEQGQPLKIVHRDVSPDNVLVTWDGQVKVADFGIARAELVGRGQTEPGVFKGKLAYAAPEQARAEAVDARADVYSAALVLEELLLGVNPQRQNAMRIAAGVERVPPFPPDVAGEALARILDEALAPEPARRTASALAFEQQLSRWLSQHEDVPGEEGVARYLAQLFPRRGAPPDDAAFEPLSPPALPGSSGGTPAPSRSARAPATRTLGGIAPGRRLAPALLVGGALLLGGALVVATTEEEVPFTPPPPPRPLAVPRPPEPPAGAAATQPAQPEALKPVVRELQGVPAVVELSSRDHGLDLRSAGFGISFAGPGAWSVATLASQFKELPPYAALFVADLGPAGELLSLGVVTRKGRALAGAEARLFLLEPDRRPDQGSFDILVKREGHPNQRRDQVYVDAVTSLAGRRFTVEGLEIKASYAVRLRPAAEGKTPPVMMLLGTPSGAAHLAPELRDTPLNQQLLAPGVTTTVTAVTRLSFVMPTLPDVPEAHATVDVFHPGAAPPGRGGSRPPQRAAPEPLFTDKPTTAEGWLDLGSMQLERGKHGEAYKSFSRCLLLDPGRALCAELRDVARTKGR